MVNIFTVIFIVYGKLIQCHTGKQSKCHLVKKFIDIYTKAIICPTTSGFTAAMVSKFTPEAPIFAFVSSEQVQRKLLLYSGIETVLYERQTDVEAMISESVSILKELGHIAVDDIVVITAGLPYDRKGNTNTMKVHVVE